MMFKQARLGWIVLTLLVAIVPLAARAGLGHHRCGHCGRCARPFAACGCAQPFCGVCQMAPANCSCQLPVVQTQIVPQTTTIYRQQQFTTLQPVTRTEIRRQAQVIDVPVTACKQVTVDEGTYQTVWVPKLTTKVVSETTIQKQVRYQDVPYQVVQQVPVMQTRIIPQQITTYAQQTTVASAPIHNHDHGIAGIDSHVTSMSSPTISFEPIAESTALAPTPEAYSQTALVHDHPALVETPVPAATPAVSSFAASTGESGTWSKVPSKQAREPGVQLQAYEVEARPVSSQNSRPAAAAIPSAARIWAAQGGYSRN